MSDYVSEDSPTFFAPLANFTFGKAASSAKQSLFQIRPTEVAYRIDNGRHVFAKLRNIFKRRRSLVIGPCSLHPRRSYIAICECMEMLFF